MRSRGYARLDADGHVYLDYTGGGLYANYSSTGCFCNPGAGEVAFTISRETLLGSEFGDGMIVEDYVREIGLPSGGAIRASLGIVSNFADVYRFLQFATELVDLTTVPDDLPPRTAC